LKENFTAGSVRGVRHPELGYSSNEDDDTSTRHNNAIGYCRGRTSAKDPATITTIDETIPNLETF
jgi:hypothetical protein